MNEVKGEGGSRYVRFMTKRDIVDLLRYEKLTGYEFNRMPCDEFLTPIRQKMRLPVGLNMMHNGVEMRVSVCTEKNSALVDMPFRMYFALPVFDTETMRVVKFPPPENVPQDPPRKGINVIYSLRKSDVMTLRSRGDKVVTAHVNATARSGESGESEANVSLDEIMAAWKQSVDIIHACMSSMNQVSCSAIGADRKWTIEATMPVSEFFALPNRIVVWPGWGRLPEEEAPNAA